MTDRTVGPNLIIVIAPILYFLPCVVKGQEPMGVQTLRAEPTIKCFDIGIVGRLSGLESRRRARSIQFKYDIVGISPEIEITTDKFRSLALDARN